MVEGWTGMRIRPCSGLSIWISPSSIIDCRAVASLGLRTISLMQITDPMAAARPILPSRAREMVAPLVGSVSSTVVPISSAMEDSGVMLASV